MYNNMQVTSIVANKYPTKSDSITVKYDSWGSGTEYHYMTPSSKEEDEFCAINQWGISVSDSIKRELLPQAVVDKIPRNLYVRKWEGCAIKPRIAEIITPRLVGVDATHLLVLSYDNQQYHFVSGELVNHDAYTKALAKVKALELQELDKRTNNAYGMLKESKAGQTIRTEEVWADTNIGMRIKKGIRSFLLVSITKTHFKCRLHNGCFGYSEEVCELPLYYLKKIK